jgi:UDP-N-acetylglucosamine--N-acetylmuramyl-(pentapeptide) pyrophosphoryl-undecaprenol N-acetylglucosamine transferase
LVLIFGGSQGSRNINESTWTALPDLLPYAHILHVVGVRDWPMYQAYALANPLQEHIDRYHPVEYLHDEMSLALAAADVAVARAGASTLGEFPVAGLPSILVPLPHAGVNQQANAGLMHECGAGIIIEDLNLAAELTPVLTQLLQNVERRTDMSAAAKNLARPDAAERIVEAMRAITKDKHSLT